MSVWRWEAVGGGSSYASSFFNYVIFFHFRLSVKTGIAAAFVSVVLLILIAALLIVFKSKFILHKTYFIYTKESSLNEFVNGYMF